jgi:hypothetical protein
MSTDTRNTSLVKAADAAGYAMAAREDDLAEVLHPEVALRNGHAAAAGRSLRPVTLPFARLQELVAHLFAMSDFSRTHSTRALLTSR